MTTSAPWSLLDVHQQAHRPRGSVEPVRSELAAFTGERDIPETKWPIVLPWIEGLARGLNAQTEAMSRDPPTAKDAGRKLQQVKDLAKALGDALAELDDVSLDWLTGSENPILGWGPTSLKDNPEFVASRRHLFGARALEGRTDLRRVVRGRLAPTLWSLASVADQSRQALIAEHGPSRGGEADLVSRGFGQPKHVMVEGACFLVWLVAGLKGARALTATMDKRERDCRHPRPSLERLVRAIHEYATGGQGRNSTESFERALKDIVPRMRRELMANHRAYLSLIASNPNVAQILQFGF